MRLASRALPPFWVMGLLLVTVQAIVCSIVGKAAFPTERLGERGDFYILSVGMNGSGVEKGSLRFAEADANAVGEAFRRHHRRIARRVFVTTLLGKVATEKALLGALDATSRRVHPEDLFLFFFAGQGERSSEDPNRPEAFFRLYDSPPGGGIRGNTVRGLIRRVQSRQTLLVLDTCYGALTFRGSKESSPSVAFQGGDDVAGALGASLMMIGSPGLAFESPDLHHGVNTAAILEGLDGAADANHDGVITAAELASYMTHRIPLMVGAPASVVFSATGPDFPVATVAAALPREALQLPAITLDVPVYTPDKYIPTTSESLSLKGHIEHSTSLELDGALIPVSADGSFSVSLKVPVGASVARFIATDTDGNATDLRVLLDRSSRGGPEPTPAPIVTTSESEPPPAARHDRALLFATDSYRSWNPLTNPTQDAEAIARVLRKTYGFDAVVVPNPKRSDIVSKLKAYQKDYQNKPAAATDELLVFFACHGLYDDTFNDGFIVASNSPSTLDDSNDRDFIEHASLFKLVDQIKCKHILLMMDSCFSGSYFDSASPMLAAGAGPRSGAPLALAVLGGFWPGLTAEPAGGFREDVYPDRSRDSQIAELLRFKTRKLITSGGREYTSDGVPGRHSPFVAKLLEGLGKGDGLLTAAGLYDNYLIRVTPQTPKRGRFTPEAAGEFVFVPQPRP